MRDWETSVKWGYWKPSCPMCDPACRLACTWVDLHMLNTHDGMCQYCQDWRIDTNRIQEVRACGNMYPRVMGHLKECQGFQDFMSELALAGMLDELLNTDWR